MDWSEQRHHLAGALGLLTRFIDLGWIERAKTTRVVQVTDTGRAGLAETFDIDSGTS